ncbi:MAG: nucleotidyltransferase substrate binding protein [Candidatus Caenarcaniphilales bacterium]|jgi:nucleotidyltransferase substrate binding protein (TIGR01987 family)|nr:nucleotidyltransferase substrate binding protein [Candidatus Caenarcaniphilales bacterium]
MNPEFVILGRIDLESLVKASQTFVNAFDKVHDDLDRAGLIKYFEFCYELSWKSLKRVLKDKGIDTTSFGPRDVFREAATYDLIEDAEEWISFIEQRNLTVHTYKEETAKLVFSNLNNFKVELIKLVQKLLSLK